MNMNTMRGSASRTLSRLLITFCAGVAATLAWWYGHAARQMIANSHPLLGWLAPAEPVAQNPPDMVALAAQPSFDHQQLSTMSLDLDAVQQGIDRIAADQEQITRSVDEIATTIAGGQEQTTRNARQTSTSIAPGKEQMTPSIDQTATDIGHDPSATVSSTTVENRADGASSQPTAHLNTKPTEAKSPQTLSESGKQFSAASGHDSSCLSSASAVLQSHPGGRPSWTLRAPGHEGTKCWYAATRIKASEPSK
jgi:hypothetical protein